MQVQPYLMFNGRCDEAIEFYKKALGAKVEMVMRFKDAPEGHCAPGMEDKVMHSAFRIGDTVVMATDHTMQPGDRAEFKGISLTLNPGTEAEAVHLAHATPHPRRHRAPRRPLPSHSRTFRATPLVAAGAARRPPSGGPPPRPA